MLLINELAQWAVLAVLGIFVVGLTRQLGAFLVAPKDLAALEAGPDVGASLPKGFLSTEERRTVDAALRTRGEDAAVVFLVVSEECAACKGLLAGIEEDGIPEGVVVVAYSRGSGDEHRRRLESVSDLAIVDEKRLDEADLPVTPFAVVTDAKLRVLHKQVAWRLPEVVASWRPDRYAPPVRDAQPAPDSPQIVHVGGDS